MGRLIPAIAALVLLAYAFPSDSQVPDRRWIVQTSDGKLIGFTDDQDVDPPDAAFATFVLESVIRAADPPGATGEILPLGTWDGTDYTAPSGGGIVVHIDPTSAIGGVQEACIEHAGRFRCSACPSFMTTGSHGQDDVSAQRPVEGIYWQIINTAAGRAQQYADA